VAAVVGGGGAPNGWDQVGEAFSVINAVFSAIALVIVGFTLWIQFKELRMQRAELRMQREATERSQQDLHRSAEANLRALHVDLIKMAIEDEHLADVWPEMAPGLSSQRRKQYLHANLVIQHQVLLGVVGNRDPEAVRTMFRFLMKSSVVREFWTVTYADRQELELAGSAYTEFMKVCHEVFREQRGEG
jgi:Flp pilus assembly protein TadB